MRPIGRRGKWLAGSALAVAAVGGAFAFIPTASGAPSAIQSVIASDSSQTSTVESTFTAAITADRQSQAPGSAATAANATADNASTYRAQVNTAVAGGKVAPAASSAVRQSQKSDGELAIGKYFTPGQAKHEEIGMNNAIQAESDPKFRNLGAGVSSVKYDNVAVSGNTATLTADVTIWSKFQQQQADGSWTTSDPTNVMVYSVTMSRESGKWLVDSMVGDFAPGEGP